MNTTSKTSLHRCLLLAILNYNYDLREEQGGFILRKLREVGKKLVKSTYDYKYVPVTNKNTGTSIASVLYEPNDQEFSTFVVLPTLDDDWEIYASYHTHPIGMRAMPSNTDLTKLFTSFPVNYIYAPGKELNRFDYGEAQGQGWIHTNIIKFNGYDADRYLTNPKRCWTEAENI